MASNNEGSGMVLGILLVVIVVGFGAWMMGVTPWHRQTNSIVVETPTPVVPAPAQPSAGNGNTTN
jgi:hypothetical protein